MKALTFVFGSLLVLSSVSAFASQDLAGTYTCKFNVHSTGDMKIDAADKFVISRQGRMISFSNITDSSDVQPYECKNGSVNQDTDAAKVRALVKCSKSAFSIAIRVRAEGVSVDTKMSLTKKDSKTLSILATIDAAQEGDESSAEIKGVCVQK